MKRPPYAPFESPAPPRFVSDEERRLQRASRVVEAVLYLVIFLVAAFITAVACSGCGTPPAVIALSDAQLQAWRDVRREGKTWSDAEWDAALRGYAAEAAQIGVWLRDGRFEPGIAFQLLKREDDEP